MGDRLGIAGVADFLLFYTLRNIISVFYFIQSLLLSSWVNLLFCLSLIALGKTVLGDLIIIVNKVTAGSFDDPYFSKMAVKSTSLSILEELLTCSVCLEFFANPKTLPCHHSFCQTCLEKLPKENAHSFLCPTCRCLTQVPDGGVAGIPAAFYLAKCKEMHSQMRKEIKCDNCDKSNAAGYCKMCHESLCTSCIEVHNKWNRFSNHKIVDVILVQNLLSAVEQFRQVKDALVDSKRGEVKQHGEGQEDREHSENIDNLLHLLTGEGKSIKGVSNDDEAEHLLMELNCLLIKQNSNPVLTDYYEAAIPCAVMQQCTVKVNKVNCTNSRLLSFSLSIQLPASGHVVIPVSSIKCRLIPMIKGKEQHKDKYKITTTSAPGVYQVDCCPLASGTHSLSVHIHDVQLESVPLMVPFNPHFDTIAPARAIYGFKSLSSVAVSDDSLIIFTEQQYIDKKTMYSIKCFNSQDNIVPEAASVIKSYDLNQFVCVSSKNEVIVIAQRYLSVEVLTLKGELVRKMTDSINFIKNPSCVVISSITGYIYIADGDNVHILSSDLRFIRSFGGKGSKNGEFNGVYGVAIAVIDDEEFLYVTDHSNHRIQKFTHVGKYLSTFGTEGSDPGQLQSPRGITVGTGNLLYITEWGTRRISVFTLGGDFIRCFGGYGNNIDQFYRPSGIKFDSNGVMYVCDSYNNRLVLY